MDRLLRWSSSILSPAGPGARLTVVTFHRVVTEADPLQPELPTAQEFAQRLNWLNRQFNILPLAKACDDLYAGKLKERSAAITFDDGYRDNLSNALTLIASKRLSATVFVATGFSNGKNMFNDEIIEAVRSTKKSSVDAQSFDLGRIELTDERQRYRAIELFIAALKYASLNEREEKLRAMHSLFGTTPARPLMMTPEDIRSFKSSYIEIGAHTRNHPILLRESDATALEEIENSRDDVKEMIGSAPRLFAFPNGKRDDDFSIKHCSMVQKAGFDFGFTTDPATASMKSDRYLLPRVSMWAPTRFRTGLSLLKSLREDSA